MLTGSASDGDVNLTSIGGTFGYKTHNGRTGLGVTDLIGGDPTHGEIDIDEAISGAFTLSGGVKIDGFELLFIYNGNEYSDPNELATITINNSLVYTFNVNGENTGLWSGGLGASVNNCGATDGEWLGLLFHQQPVPERARDEHQVRGDVGDAAG